MLSAAQQAEAFAALARLRTAGLVPYPDSGRGAPGKPVAAALAVLRGEFDVVDDVTLSSEAKATAAATTFGLSHPRKVLEYVALLGQLANRKPVQAVAVAGGGAAAATDRPLVLLAHEHRSSARRAAIGKVGGT